MGVFKQEKLHEAKEQWISTPDGVLLTRPPPPPKRKKKKRKRKQKQKQKKQRNKTKHDHGAPAYKRQFFCMQLVS